MTIIPSSSTMFPSLHDPEAQRSIFSAWRSGLRKLGEGWDAQRYQPELEWFISDDGEPVSAFEVALHGVRDQLFGSDPEPSMVFRVAQELEKLRKERNATKSHIVDAFDDALEGDTTDGETDGEGALGGAAKGKGKGGKIRGRFFNAVTAVIRVRHELHSLQVHPIPGVDVKTMDGSSQMHWIAKTRPRADGDRGGKSRGGKKAKAKAKAVRVHVCFPSTYPQHGPSVWYRHRRPGEQGSKSRALLVEVDSEEVFGSEWDSMHSSAAELLEAIQGMLTESGVWAES